jgi:hypothetical protein
MSGPHDLFIHYVLGRQECAAALLRVVLPPPLAARVDWRTLRHASAHAVSARMQETRGDLIFQARLRGSTRPISLLVEHQSGEDERMAARMFQYLLRHQEKWQREHPRSRKVPLILPVVLAHGARGRWRSPRRLEERVDIPLEAARREGWEGYLVRMEYVLYDVMERSEEELRKLPGPPLVRLALVLLRGGRARELNERLKGWVDLFERVYATPNGPEDLGAVGCYLSDIGDEVTCEVMREVLHSFMTRERTEELMQTVGARLRTEGRAEGRAEGKASYLLRALAARGVRVDDSFRQRVLDCKDAETLDRWFDRALHAHTLADVLGEPAR